MKIPADATVEVQQAFREIWEAIDQDPIVRDTNPGEIDLRGSRVTNAGFSLLKRDYVIRAELDQFADSIIKKRSSVQPEGAVTGIVGKAFVWGSQQAPVVGTDFQPNFRAPWDGTRHRVAAPDSGRPDTGPHRGR